MKTNLPQQVTCSYVFFSQGYVTNHNYNVLPIVWGNGWEGGGAWVIDEHEEIKSQTLFLKQGAAEYR
jgi:hypothetical protein